MIIVCADSIIVTVIASRSGFGVSTGVPHSKIEIQTEFKSFTAAHLESNTNQTWIEHLEAHASNPAGQFMPLI